VASTAWTLPRTTTSSAWTSPADFEIIAKERKKDHAELEELENEDIRISDHAHDHRRRKGFGKRTALAEYRITRAGGKGVVNMKTTTATVRGSTLRSRRVRRDDITEHGKVIRVHATKSARPAAPPRASACSASMAMTP